MVRTELHVRESVKHALPWLGPRENQQPSALKKTADRVAVDTILRIAPHISDQNLVALFDRKIKELTPYDEGQEFLKLLVIQTKRMLTSPEFKPAITKLIKRMLDIEHEIHAKRDAFRAKYNNTEPPGFIAISPSMRCNLRCVGCYAGEYSKKDDLGSETLNRVVKEARDMGAPFFVFIGGEPFFCEDALNVWEANPDVSFMVYTNGTLIDEAMAKRLARMGNVYPAISLEGYEEETDARRGKGIYAKIMRAMDNLKKEGVPFGFSATVVRTNNELISSPDFVDYYARKGCFMGWYFNYIPIGREPDMSLMPTPEQRIARYNRIRQLRKTHPVLLADFWCDGAVVGGCLAAGRDYFHVNNNGDVEPCVFAHFAVDNVKNKSLEELMMSSFFTNLRARQPFSENLLRPCMVIDNPDILRNAVAANGAHPTHTGAESLVDNLSGPLDKYASNYARVADAEWAKIRAKDKPGK